MNRCYLIFCLFLWVLACGSSRAVQQSSTTTVATSSLTSHMTIQRGQGLARSTCQLKLPSPSISGRHVTLLQVQVREGVEYAFSVAEDGGQVGRTPDRCFHKFTYTGPAEIYFETRYEPRAAVIMAYYGNRGSQPSDMRPLHDIEMDDEQVNARGLCIGYERGDERLVLCNYSLSN